ncbi:MAG: DUF423 domain-containing protein [Sulfuricaulis sp.]
MPPSSKLILILGAINAAFAVLLGAFGAHGLKARMTVEMLVVYQTGVQYHLSVSCARAADGWDRGAAHS